MGTKHVIVRGSTQSGNYMFDKVKLYVDGVDINAKTYGTTTYYMNFPIELVARIEVLRGAASAIYGQGAYNGAVNIITKSSVSSSYRNVTVETGSYEYFKGSSVLHTQLEAWHLGIDGYYQRHDRFGTWQFSSADFVPGPCQFGTFGLKCILFGRFFTPRIEPGFLDAKQSILFSELPACRLIRIQRSDDVVQRVVSIQPGFQRFIVKRFEC